MALHQNGLSISAPDLIELLERVKEVPRNPTRNNNGNNGVNARLVLFIIAKQKEQDAIPAMMSLGAT